VLAGANHHAFMGPGNFGFAFFDPAGRVAIPVLYQHIPGVFRSPRSVHHHPSRVWHYSATSLRPFSRQAIFSAHLPRSGRSSAIGCARLPLSGHTTLHRCLIPEQQSLFHCWRQWLSPCHGVKVYFSWIGNHVAADRRVQDHYALAVRVPIPFTVRRSVKVSFSPKQRSDAIHDTLLLVVAHFTTLIEPGAVFAIFAGIYFYLPKFTAACILNWRWETANFWAMFNRCETLPLPQHILGRQVLPRRYIDYPEAFAYWNLWSSIGAFLSFASFIFFLPVVMFLYTDRGARSPAANP